jgi:hypothetical protein
MRFQMCRFRSLLSVPVPSVALLFGDSSGPGRPLGPRGPEESRSTCPATLGYINSLSLEEQPWAGHSVNQIMF